MPNRDSAIGVFDSGIGGLTVLQQIIEALPSENTVYLGDTARSPYGTKSVDTVLRYSFENTEFLVEKGVKIVVLACNTSTAIALEPLQKKLAIPVVGVIAPGVKRAVASTKNKKIGVIGTEATIQSGARVSRGLQPGLSALRPAGRGRLDGQPSRRMTVKTYLESLKQSGIDTLILGCTHYPLLKKAIGKFLGGGVHLVDSAEETAREVRAMLKRAWLARQRGNGSHGFFVTDAPERFIKVGRRFLGERVESAVRIER